MTTIIPDEMLSQNQSAIKDVEYPFKLNIPQLLEKKESHK